MALDYKTLHAVVAVLPQAEDRYCPDCGQSLTSLVAVAIDKPSPRPWFWVMLAVGIYLVVASGMRAWNDEQMVAHPQLLTGLTRPINGENWSPAKEVLSNAVKRLHRDLIVAGMGLVLVLLGLSSVARRRLLRREPNLTGVSRVLLRLWDPAETLVVSLFGVLLLLFSYLLVSELIAGEILTRTLTDRTINRSVDVIMFAVDVIAAGEPAF